MTIYILDNDPKLTAQYLDDKSLDQMIRDIAQVLVNAHWEDLEPVLNLKYKEIPMEISWNKNIVKWHRWARESKANYLYLVGLGLACDWEAAYRKDFKLSKKYHDIIEWARDNVPDLPSYVSDDIGWSALAYIFTTADLPIIMPKKYRHVYGVDLHDGCIGYHGQRIQAYRNYYIAMYNKRESRRCSESKKYGEIRTKELTWTNRKRPDFIKL